MRCWPSAGSHPPWWSPVSRIVAGSDDLWLRLNPVAVNTGITKVVGGRRGLTVVSYNDHAHLEGPHADLLSYR